MPGTTSLRSKSSHLDTYQQKYRGQSMQQLQGGSTWPVSGCRNVGTSLKWVPIQESCRGFFDIWKLFETFNVHYAQHTDVGVWVHIYTLYHGRSAICFMAEWSARQKSCVPTVIHLKILDVLSISIGKFNPKPHGCLLALRFRLFAMRFIGGSTCGSSLPWNLVCQSSPRDNLHHISGGPVCTAL